MSIWSWVKHVALAVAGLTALAVPLLPRAAHSQPLAGPIPAHVITVTDGDTALVEARIWLDQTVRTRVRLLGVDAPESGGRAKCESERSKAAQAKAYLVSIIEGRDVLLRDIDYDKYGRRIDARVVLPDGADISDLLLAKGYAVPYDGGRKTSWCGVAAAR